MEKLLHNCNCTKGRHSKPRSSFKYRLLRISTKENSTQHMSSISWAEILRASLEKAVHVRSTVRGPCRRVLLDIRYLVRHSIPNWSGRLPLNPVQRPRTTFFLFFLRHCRSLVLSHHPLQATLPDAREKGREREKRDRRVRTFPVKQAVVDSSMKLWQDTWAFHSFSFFFDFFVPIELVHAHRSLYFSRMERDFRVWNTVWLSRFE